LPIKNSTSQTQPTKTPLNFRAAQSLPKKTTTHHPQDKIGKLYQITKEGKENTTTLNNKPTE
jgi:hypothetical protein